VAPLGLREIGNDVIFAHLHSPIDRAPLTVDPPLSLAGDPVAALLNRGG